jgi:hypothetical protein
MTTALRTSRSMTAWSGTAPVPVVDNGSRPLGYLYATGGTCDHSGPAAEMGHYDPDSQTWVDRHGFITAGVATKTRCPCGCGYVTDDACF